MEKQYILKPLSTELCVFFEDVLYKTVKKKLKNNIESRNVIIILCQKDYDKITEHIEGDIGGYHIRFELGKRFKIIFK